MKRRAKSDVPTEAAAASSEHVKSQVLAAEIDLTPFREAPFSSILQDLERLLSQCRLSFLLGAGSSACAGLPLMDRLTELVQNKLAEPTSSILGGIIANFAGAKRCTIEDYMSELVDHLSVAERRNLRGASVPGVKLSEALHEKQQLLDALNDIKRAIGECVAKPASGPTIEFHRKFVQTIHAALRSGKTSAALLRTAKPMRQLRPPKVPGFHVRTLAGSGFIGGAVVSNASRLLHPEL